MVTINEFAALDIRVGKIIEIDDLAESKKPMYNAKVDLGTEIGTRNIIMGLPSFYTKEELLNRRVVVITNLEPKRIANQVSEGMVLAADDGEHVSLLEPDKEMPTGSRVR